MLKFKCVLCHSCCPFSLFLVHFIIVHKVDCDSLNEIEVKLTQTLESFVACWPTCPQQNPTNGVINLNSSWNKKCQNDGHGWDSRDTFPHFWPKHLTHVLQTPHWHAKAWHSQMFPLFPKIKFLRWEQKYPLTLLTSIHQN